MIRRSSLALTGLFHTGCRFVDHEFFLRLTGVANLAWFTSVVVVHIDNPASGVRRYADTMLEELNRTEAFYGYKREPSNVPFHWFAGKMATFTGRLRRGVLHPMSTARKIVGNGNHNHRTTNVATDPVDPAKLFSACELWLAQYHTKNPGEFLSRSQK